MVNPEVFLFGKPGRNDRCRAIAAGCVGTDAGVDAGDLARADRAADGTIDPALTTCIVRVLDHDTNAGYR